MPDRSLDAIIERYEDALVKYHRGEVNYPLGEDAHRVQGWLNEAREERSRRA